MSRALGVVLLRMFGGHGGSPEQDLRERPQEEIRLEEKPGPARCKPLSKPLHPRLISPLALNPYQGGA